MEQAAPTDHLLVVDGSQVNGQVVLVRCSRRAGVATREIATDATFFHCTSGGQFLLRNRANRWITGNLKEPQAAIPVAFLPESTSYAALSPDGKMAACCTEERGTSRLLLGDLQTGQRRDLLPPGRVIRVPSWSPDSTRIAYYCGPPEAIAEDGFRLEVIRASGAGNMPREVAPASKPIGLSAERRRPPQWSPDGQIILFEANYEADNLVRSRAYLVDPERQGVQHIPAGGVWSADGKHLLTVRRSQLPFGPFVLSKLEVATGTQEDIPLQTDLPPNAGNGRWKPDGRAFAFADNENQVRLIDVVRRTETRLIEFPASASVLWLQDTPATSAGKPAGEPLSGPERSGKSRN